MQLGFDTGVHPHLFMFLDKLKQIQKSYDINYERIIAGHEPSRKRARHEEADERILNKGSRIPQFSNCYRISSRFIVQL